MDKKEIDVNVARKILMTYVDSWDLGDRFYGFVMDFCNYAIQKIESQYTIVGLDGTPYTDDDDETWYDDYRFDFMDAVFEKIQSGDF